MARTKGDVYMYMVYGDIERVKEVVVVELFDESGELYNVVD